jgi:glycosyltransferase involved in cell wall biosynthesis
MDTMIGITPFVSVILATYNRRRILEECLDSLFNQSYPRDRYEVIVVNDSSTDKTLEFLGEYSKKHPALVYFTQENQGPYIAKNLGIKNARGEIICFTGDDCIAERGWIEKIVNKYSDNQIGGVGGVIASYPPKSMAERYCYTTDPFNQEILSKVYLMTGNASYTRKVLDEVGGFDPFFRYSGDCDLGLMVNIRGYRIAYASDAVVYHKHGETLEEMIRQWVRYGKGYSRMHKKYPKNFNLMKRLPYLIRTFIIGAILIVPMLVKSLIVEDRIFYLTKRVLDVLLIVPYVWGMIAESLAGDDYPKEKVNLTLEFISKAGIGNNWGD